MCALAGNGGTVLGLVTACQAGIVTGVRLTETWHVMTWAFRKVKGISLAEPKGAVQSRERLGDCRAQLLYRFGLAV